jgi:hypothetical protein
MPAVSHTLLDTKLAAATNLLAVPTTNIPLELPFEYVGLRTRQQSQASSEIAMAPQTIAAIGDFSSGIKCKRVAPPRKANKGATKKVATRKGANKKGAKDVVSKNNSPHVHHRMYITQCRSPNVDHPMFITQCRTPNVERILLINIPNVHWIAYNPSCDCYYLTQCMIFGQPAFPELWNTYQTYTHEVTVNSALTNDSPPLVGTTRVDDTERVNRDVIFDLDSVAEEVATVSSHIST